MDIYLILGDDKLIKPFDENYCKLVSTITKRIGSAQIIINIVSTELNEYQMKSLYRDKVSMINLKNWYKELFNENGDVEENKR